MITNLADQLRRDESLKLRPYRDSVGKLTIGIGRNLDDVGISEKEADFLLANDIAAATVALESTFPWTAGLDDVRKGALIAMTFNLGIHGLSEFRDFLNKMQDGDYRAAAGAMLDSRWAREVGDRAQRPSLQVESGSWQ